MGLLHKIIPLKIMLLLLLVSSSSSSSYRPFMQGIYNYIPQTNHVSRLYSVAAVPYLQLVLHVMLLRQ